MYIKANFAITKDAVRTMVPFAIGAACMGFSSNLIGKLIFGTIGYSVAEKFIEKHIDRVFESYSNYQNK